MRITTTKKEYQQACEYRDAAIADGWSHEPTYALEEESRACFLKKDGFEMMVFTRPPGPQQKYYVSINIWGPDRLAVIPPPVYDWDKIQRRTRYCDACKAENVDTVRYGFAGRCCKACLPAMQAKHETRGWAD